jgi:hypothetical protein
MPSDAGGTPLQFSYSSDGGASWNRRLRFPGSNSEDEELPSIAFAPDGKLYAVWQDGTTNGIMSTTIQGWQTSGVRSTEPTQSDIEVYPNPASSSVTFVLTQAASGVCNATVTNSNGATVQQVHLTPHEGAYTLDVRGLSSGVYRCSIEIGSQRWTAGFLVE